MINYLFKNLKGTDWAMLSDFVSPVFFEVVPAFGMAKVFGTIVQDYANSKEFQSVKSEVRTATMSKINHQSMQPLQLLDSLSAVLSVRDLSEKDRKDFGAMVLKIYFAQIFATHKTILDLRSSAFNGTKEWAPKPVFYQWSNEFRSGLQDLYRGFYKGDDDVFQKGLVALNLKRAESVIGGHFGTGEQDAVVFSLQHLKDSLHRVFISCKASKSRLHPDFFALGVYLLCLYENLEALGCPLDVRKSFNEVAG